MYLFSDPFWKTLFQLDYIISTLLNLVWSWRRHMTPPPPEAGLRHTVDCLMMKYKVSSVSPLHHFFASGTDTGHKGVYHLIDLLIL